MCILSNEVRFFFSFIFLCVCVCLSSLIHLLLGCSLLLFLSFSLNRFNSQHTICAQRCKLARVVFQSVDQQTANAT